jgi:hypothetical protein
VVDVIENHFDGIPNPDKDLPLPDSKLNELGELVDGFYGSWTMQPPATDEFRTNACGVSRLRLSWLLGELLYAHSAVIYDPLEWALTYARGESLRDEVAEAIWTLGILEPLIRGGAVVPVPAGRLIAERQTEVEKAAREIVGDHATFWFDVVGADSDPYGIKPYVVARPWARHLAVADATSSHLTPIDDSSFRLYEWSLRQAAEQLREVDADLLIISRAFAAQLPWLSPSNPQTLIEIRQQDGDFEDWRAALRGAARTLDSLPTDATFADDARQAFNDSLGFAAEKLRTARSPTIRGLQEGGLHVTLGAAGLAVGASVASLPIGGPLIGLGAGQLAAFLTRSILKRDDLSQPGSGRTAVLAALVNDNPQPAAPFGRT